MERDNLIREKLQKVCEYGRRIQGKKFSGTPFQSDRNQMARAVIFQIKWLEFMEFTGECHETWTKEEEDKAIELLDFLIQVCESSSDTWELFWQGKQPMNPQKMPFKNLKENKVEFIDLTEVQEVEIPFLGIKG